MEHLKQTNMDFANTQIWNSSKKQKLISHTYKYGTNIDFVNIQIWNSSKEASKYGHMEIWNSPKEASKYGHGRRETLGSQYRCSVTNMDITQTQIWNGSTKLILILFC